MYSRGLGNLTELDMVIYGIATGIEKEEFEE